MKSIFVISCALVILAVPNSKAEKVEKLQVLNSGGQLYEKWQNAVVKKCKAETSILVLAIFEGKQSEGYTMTDLEVNKLRDTLLFSCSKFHNLAI